MPVFGTIPNSLPSLSLSPSLAAPPVVPNAQPVSLGIAPSVAVTAANAVSVNAVQASKSAAAPKPVQATAAALAATQLAASKAVEGLSKVSGDSASSKASAQFSALVADPLASPSRSDESLTPASGKMGALTPSGLSAKTLGTATESAPAAEEKAGPPAPQKAGITQVFKDPERNKAFWRYVGGYSVFLFGFEMYVVGLPYLISAITRNSLTENHDARAANEEALKTLIRSNRSLARIAHWVAQGVSYITIPLFTRGIEKDGPKKWLVRSMLTRAAVLAGIAGLFFATGLLSVTGSLWVFLGLVALQSFAQGISVTFEGAATTRIMGDASVTSEERTKANSILTFVAAIFSIIAPVVAGQIAQIGPVMGKTGVGGAVIYSIYAGAIALTALVYASIKMIGGAKKTDLTEKPGAEPAAEAAPKGLGGTLKSLWTSIKDGTKIVFKDRFLRTLLLMSMVTSLFSDPLVFNVLPEYIEGLVAKNPGSVGAIMNMPVIGWVLKSLTSTPMGNFAMMMVMASVGSIVASFLIKPMTKLFQKLGFKTDEALTIPFYVLAALEAPLFLLMINTPTMLGAVALYGLQSLVVGFIGIAIQGLYQKNLGGQKDENVNKILAAQSLLGIAAAIISTYVYGFVLKDISIATSLTIAAIATGVMALLRLAAPFLSFSKASRRPPADPPAPPTPPAHAKPPSGDHHGPNSILSTHL
jgi:MFS family permease